MLTELYILVCIDETDAPPEEEESPELCTYIFLDSRDPLLLNVTPQSIDVITDISQVNSDFYRNMFIKFFQSVRYLFHLIHIF